MIDLTTVFQAVENEHLKKKDVPMKLHDMVPQVDLEGNLDLVTDEQRYGLTKTGLSSYLEKIKVPGGFFNRCSPELKREILEEHHKATKDSTLLARTYQGNSPQIRYLGSKIYGVFDDMDIVKSLTQVDQLTKLKIKEFSQSENHFIMRALTDQPIELKKGRVFYPGIQFYNSEVGQSAIKIQFMLWEQVCTNGLTVPKEILKSFVKKHLGTKFTSDALISSAREIIEALPEFVNQAQAQVGVMTKISGKDALEWITDDRRIPKKIVESIPLFLPNYAGSLDEASGMDIISSYTEAIQKYSWEDRTQYEDIAGELLFGR